MSLWGSIQTTIVTYTLEEEEINETNRIKMAFVHVWRIIQVAISFSSHPDYNESVLIKLAR